MIIKMDIICFLLLFGLMWTNAEIYTAISDLESLLETHEKVIDDLNDYITKEEMRFNILKAQLDIYRREHYKAMEDIPNYLGNPINAFTLIKRLTTDLDFIKDNINKGSEIVIMNHDDLKYPVSEDLVGAAQALTRLQETYSLRIYELAEGIINGVNYSYPMTMGDCYELGRVLFQENDFENSLEWMRLAYKKIKDEPQYITKSISEVQILDYIRQSLYSLGYTNEAVVWTEMLLTLDPQHVQANYDILRYKETVANEGNENQRENIRRERVRDQDKDLYESLCRGEMAIAEEVNAKLRCRYVNEHHPFLKYAPIKVEEMFKDPTVLVFYDVLSNSEIEFVQSMAKPRIKRAMVYDSTTGKDKPCNYRISKSGWLADYESPVLARISQRISDMTGLSMAYAEDLQVANYGIGGFYATHYDFIRMSDVNQGGATVFPELGLTLYPKKGAAAFWLNLHPSGQGDLATRHAACPVLLGSKWVCNRWLHQTGQELIKPCTLEYQDESILHIIPKPITKTDKII